MTVNNSSHRILVLGSLGEFVELVKMAKAKGYYTIVCDGYHGSPAKLVADKSYDIDVRNVDAIAQMCKKENVDGIIGSFSDLLFEQITKIAAKADLKWYAKPDMLAFYREKNMTKKLLSEIGVRVPKNCTIAKYFKDDELDGYKFPLVIKPVNGYGSKGIYVVHSISEIRAKFADITAYSEIDLVQVEEYSEGREYNMMTWLIDGKVNVISIADREKNPQAGETIPLLNRVAYPSATIQKVLPEAKDVLQRFAEKTGQREGALSMQFFYNEHGVEVCEIAGRFFGYEHEMVTMCGGVNVEELLLSYVYEPEKIPAVFKSYNPDFKKHTAGLYFLAVPGKKLADLSSLDELAKDPHVCEYIPFYKEGETVEVGGSRPYFARYYITAPNREELDAVTDKFFASASAICDDGSDTMIRFIRQK